jgi:hypothetical protein
MSLFFFRIYSYLFHLMNIGKYGPQIQQALYDAGHASWSGDNVLFKCQGGPNGAIKFVKGCGGGCVDNGNNKSDTCR